MKRELRIAELQLAVEYALQSAEYTGQRSARVQSVPDTRAIRYYTTLGILDRPAEMKGRTAYYDKRHVLQLVAIKRLQAQGKTLGDIQNEITGLSNRKLSSIAKLPTGFWDKLEKQLSKATAKPKKVESKVREFVLQRSDRASDVAQDRSIEDANERAFWKSGVAVGHESDQAIVSSQIKITNETRLSFPGGVSISIPMSKEEVTEELVEELLPWVQKLSSEVSRVMKRHGS